MQPIARLLSRGDNLEGILLVVLLVVCCIVAVDVEAGERLCV